MYIPTVMIKVNLSETFFPHQNHLVSIFLLSMNISIIRKGNEITNLRKEFEILMFQGGINNKKMWSVWFFVIYFICISCSYLLFVGNIYTNVYCLLVICARGLEKYLKLYSTPPPFRKKKSSNF